MSVKNFVSKGSHEIKGRALAFSLQERKIPTSVENSVLITFPKGLGKKEVSDSFSKFGKVVKVEKKREKGLVIFETKAAAEAAAASVQQQINDSIIPIKFSDQEEAKSFYVHNFGEEKPMKKKPKREHRGKKGSKFIPLEEEKKEDEKKSQIMKKKTLYRINVGNIPVSSTTEIILKLFEKYGTVIKIKLPERGGIIQGHCMLWYDSIDSIKAILEEKEILLKGVLLQCWTGRLQDRPWKEAKISAMMTPKPEEEKVPAVPVPVIVSEEKIPVAPSEILAEVKPAAVHSEPKNSSIEQMKIEMLEERISEYEDMLETYVCPISYTLMRDPVSASDGQTYERSTIEAWLNKNSVSPITREVLGNKTLIPNVKVRQAIQELLEKKAKIEETLNAVRSEIHQLSILYLSLIHI
eukprot:TRINITY_DN5180_c0_g1_i1.p1 TRINITY_DN5180_c0_g1~~TRINITY_DN5180_c0_g1_i1.p1  ORF type:complete len:473 (-),score=100.11 TRINITY_DN5180_c0_g1_i1:153-1382(-)